MFTVAAGATLGGTGALGGALTNNGIVGPGASVGTLTVNGNVTMGANSHFSVELSGATADRLAITGNLLDASGKIDFTAAADPQATLTKQLLLNAARNTNLSFETRWNITNSGLRKIITVATRKIGGAPPGAEPVNLKVVLAP